VTKGQVEVITPVERRRRWNATEKERLVGASLETKVGLAAVPRESGFTRANCTDGFRSCAHGGKLHLSSRRCGLHPSWWDCRRRPP
jgi:transposase-like protein